VIWRHGRAETYSVEIYSVNFITINIQISTSLWTEKNGKLLFLDVLVSKKADGTLGHQVYRKPTHTDRYLRAELHHPAQKLQLIHLYIELSIISNKEYLQAELNHLKTALQKNGHDKKDIIKTINNMQTRQLSLTHN